MKRAALLFMLVLAPPVLAQTALIPAGSMPEAGSMPAFKINVKYKEFRLPNGLTGIFHEDHSVPIATVNMWVHVGSARERPGRNRFARTFEHLVYIGTG